ncbi:MAG: (2Fe-2S)-binding protein [Chloroflexota bacterium]
MEKDCTCSRENCNGCPGRIVCHCLQVTEEMIVEAAAALGLLSVGEVRRHTGAGDGCTACHRGLGQLLERTVQSSSSPIFSVR